jgi:hypothetical protein
MLEARHFTFFTDHKPLTFAFQQKRDKCSPRQFNHLDFIAQFTTEIRHISGQNKVVADALPRVESATWLPVFPTCGRFPCSQPTSTTGRPATATNRRPVTSRAPHNASCVFTERINKSAYHLQPNINCGDTPHKLVTPT